MSRFWCLVISSSIFCLAQICALIIENPHLLVSVSGITGCKIALDHENVTLEQLLSIMALVGYGFLYGVTPSLVAESFGVAGLSTNWGVLNLSPVVFGNLFNILYGKFHLPPLPLSLLYQ